MLKQVMLCAGGLRNPNICQNIKKCKIHIYRKG